MNNDRIFRVLYNLALQSPGVVKRQGQVFKVAAALSCKKRGQIVSTGVNQIKSHPIMRVGSYYNERQIFLHAEADAIRKSPLMRRMNRSGRDLRNANNSKFQIHVLRLKRHSASGEWMLGNARPCPGCMNLIHAFGIQEIFWTEDCEMNDLVGGDCSQMSMFSTQQP